MVILRLHASRKIGLAEFETQSAIDYFTKKKTEFIGDFAENIAKTEAYLARLKGI